MKTTRHSLMAKGIIVLLSLLVMVFAFTYSWYAPPSKPVTAQGIEASVKANGDFEYAVGFYNNGTAGAYKVTPFTNESTALNLTSLQATDGNTYDLLHDYKPIDLTGDGATLIRPAMSYGNSEINTSSLDFSIAKPNQQYISFDLYFRSKSQGISVKLADGSWAKGGAEVNSGNMTGANATNKSTYGNFSKDAIVGAIRVAFINYEYTSDNAPQNLEEYQDNTPDCLRDSASLLWIPRSDLHLNSTETLTGWSLTTNSNIAADKVHRFYNIFKCQPYLSAAEGGYASDDTTNYHKEELYDGVTVTASDLSSASQTFSDLNMSFTTGAITYYYTKVNVRIWVDGLDTESRRATSGGQFAVNFRFTTI